MTDTMELMALHEDLLQTRERLAEQKDMVERVNTVRNIVTKERDALKERLDESTTSAEAANENLDHMSKYAKELERQLVETKAKLVEMDALNDQNCDIKDSYKKQLKAARTQLADGVTIEYITQGTNNTKTRAKIGDDWYVTDAIFKQVCADRDTAIADKERYSKIIDAKEEWALSLDKRLNATDADRQLLATILDALERNEDVFIRECRTPRDDRDGRWLVSQNCVTEKFTYIKEMKG